MAKYLSLLSLVILTVHAQAQYFSGEVEYELNIIPKKPGLNVDSLIARQPGTSSKYLITEGYYKSSYFRDGKLTYSYTYHDESKRMYDETAGKDYITYRDSRKGNQRLIRSVFLKDSTKDILGHPCVVVERVYERYISKTYYADDLRINVESFKDHAVGAWYQQIKEMDGRLSLGGINEYVDHIEVHRVVSITPKLLTVDNFAMPAKLIVASPDALDKQVKLNPLSSSALFCYRKTLEEVSVVKPYTSYIGFIVFERGGIGSIEVLEKRDARLDELAARIVSSCGLEFTPGEIAGFPVSSYVYFPVDFGK